VHDDDDYDDDDDDDDDDDNDGHTNDNMGIAPEDDVCYCVQYAAVSVVI
jgi:hypothetical protein